MRLTILRTPTRTIDGVLYDHLRVTDVCELSADVAGVFVREGWAETVAEVTIATVIPPLARDNANREPDVLVVDDDPDLRRLAESLLSAHGYHVRVACDGRDAMQRLREQCADLIVLDLNMPVMDGWQFRTAQRFFAEKKLAAVPVLLMTGADDGAFQADRLRAVGVITKPFNADGFLHAVSAAIGSQRSAPL